MATTPGASRCWYLAFCRGWTMQFNIGVDTATKRPQLLEADFKPSVLRCGASVVQQLSSAHCLNFTTSLRFVDIIKILFFIYFLFVKIDHKILFPCSKDKALSCALEISHLMGAFACTQVGKPFCFCCSHI